MEQLDQQTRAASPALARIACGLTVAIAAGAVVAVIGLRVANDHGEPAGQNWRLVALLLVGSTFGPAGVALAARTRSRGLGVALMVVGIGAAAAAVATQHAGYANPRVDSNFIGWIGGTHEWTLPVTMDVTTGVLVGVVPWLLVPAAERVRGWAVAIAIALVAVGVSIVNELASGPSWIGTTATWIIAVTAAAGIVHLAVRCWRLRRRPVDPLPAWILAGTIVAWLAVVPGRLDLTDWPLPGRHVVSALLLIATVPLLVGGVVIDAVRDSTSTFLGLSMRVVEWVVLASGIVALYTVVVAGLGRFAGGSGPTWLLVAATGAIALAIEPARQRVRRLVDHLVYGDRQDPLAVVQRVVDHLGADAGDALLPALVESLRTELRLDAVSIDLRVDGGWQEGASTGPPTARQRVVPLVHRGDVVGRLVVGWSNGPALRTRDAEILDQLVGPLSLAVGWVRLSEELRRSSVAIVSAREEERRRLRRDLHDGLGPSLTGVSLGLRTAIRQLERGGGPALATPRLLLERVADEVDHAVGDLKRIVRGLRPTALDELGLVDAVAAFTRGFGDALDITLTLPTEVVELPAAVETATYRIVTEAVTNVVRHAGAARCWLRIETGAAVVIDIVDDGIGLATAGAPGVGMAAMRERAAELGGSVLVSPSAPGGTHVHVRLPVALP